MNYNFLSPMSYLLSYTLVCYVQAAGEPTKHRLNLAAQIQGTIRAKAKSKVLKATENAALEGDLNQIDEKISELRETYEPFIDGDTYSYDKAGVFEKILDAITEDQKILIERYKLISKDDIAQMVLESPAMKGMMP
jgi:hypothetical protein